MKSASGTAGRAFVLRLEDGEVLHEQIELFARENSIRSASVVAVGGADDGSLLIVGPKDGRSSPIEPMTHVLDGVHELSGSGTIFIDEEGNPLLHMHASCGRNGRAVTGCVRAGVRVWLIMEVIIHEIIDIKAVRVRDPINGFALLEPEE